MNQNDLYVTAVRENVRVFTLGGESIASSYGANCTAVVRRQSVLLVDPLIAPVYARQIGAAVASWTPLPILLRNFSSCRNENPLKNVGPDRRWDRALRQKKSRVLPASSQRLSSTKH